MSIELRINQLFYSVTVIKFNIYKTTILYSDNLFLIVRFTVSIFHNREMKEIKKIFKKSF